MLASGADACSAWLTMRQVSRSHRLGIGALPFRRVGTYRRIRLADVLTLRAREEPVREALEGLAADTGH